MIALATEAGGIRRSARCDSIGSPVSASRATTAVSPLRPARSITEASEPVRIGAAGAAGAVSGRRGGMGERVGAVASDGTATLTAAPASRARLESLSMLQPITKPCRQGRRRSSRRARVFALS